MSRARVDSDLLGEIDVLSDALWGAATERAIRNFEVSARRFPRAFIQKLSLIKRFAAETNGELKLLDEKSSEAIASAAAEIAEGKHDDQFPLDIFQTGSGTSTNMNANEVVANLANLKLGGKLGEWKPIHPNDHVNLGQSSNDVMPSALNVAAACEITGDLIPAISKLQTSLEKKSKEFDRILKIGRTHLMDALPMTLGQEFGGFASQAEASLERIRKALPSLSELALGGTAVGTGMGSHKDFAKRVCEKLSSHLNFNFVPAKNKFGALSSRGPHVEVSSALKAAAIALLRIADDMRLLASGPRLGLGEIKLPALQPGSSIMPGKVNPVIPEMVCQVAYQVIANDMAISLASTSGSLELNTALPLIASNLLESIGILSNAASSFAEKCIDGTSACEDRCRQNLHMSLSLATALVPKIGYSKAAEIAKEAHAAGKSIKEIALEKKIASDEELDDLLDADRLT